MWEIRGSLLVERVFVHSNTARIHIPTFIVRRKYIQEISMIICYAPYKFSKHFQEIFKVLNFLKIKKKNSKNIVNIRNLTFKFIRIYLSQAVNIFFSQNLFCLWLFLRFSSCLNRKSTIFVSFLDFAQINFYSGIDSLDLTVLCYMLYEKCIYNEYMTEMKNLCLVI